MKKVSIFGGGYPKITQEYLDTVEIAKRFTKAGYIIKTGGYSGIMEAANKGCYENNGHSIGVVCATFKSTKGNEYLTDKIVANDLFDRLRILLDSDVFIVQKGGIGTLAEVFILLDIIRKLDNPPVVYLIGDHWYKIIDSIEDLISEKESKLINIITNINDIRYE